MPILSDATAKQAAEYLHGIDPVLARVIAQSGLCTIRPHRNYYQELVESIIGQQLSVKAAAAIRERFWGLFEAEFPTPEQLIATDVETLRSVGFSRAKAAYVHDLAQRVHDGKLRFDAIDDLSNSEVAQELTAVKGIGQWTAHMFLMFCMGRSDVLPVGDLGIRNGIRALYGFSDAPTPEQISELATQNGWHPYESVASWYIWQSLDNTPKV